MITRLLVLGALTLLTTSSLATLDISNWCSSAKLGVEAEGQSSGISAHDKQSCVQLCNHRSDRDCMRICQMCYTAVNLPMAAMRTYTDRKAKFVVEYPGSWQKSVNQGGTNLTLAPTDNLAMVQIIRADVDASTTADAFLKEVENEMGETHVNQLPEDKRHAPAEDLANMNADEGSAGYYDLDHEGQKIHQFIMILRKASVVYAVTVTFADLATDKYKDVAIKIADSVKILN